MFRRTRVTRRAEEQANRAGDDAVASSFGPTNCMTLANHSMVLMYLLTWKTGIKRTILIMHGFTKDHKCLSN